MKPSFAAVYETERPRIARYLTSRGVPATDLDDLVSQTFLDAWRTWGDYEDRGFPVSTWLHRIARSNLIDSWRYQARRETERLDDGAAYGHDFEDAICDVDAARQEVATLLHILSPLQARVVWLRYGCDCTPMTIAAMLDHPVGAVKALLARARAALVRAARPPEQRTCSMCGEPARPCGLCRRHYKQQWQRSQREGREVAATFTPADE